MPGYVKKALNKLKHPRPKKPQNNPHRWNTPVYGRHQQLAREQDTSPPISTPEKSGSNQLWEHFFITREQLTL